MLMRTDPFRELDRLTQQVLGTAARPAAMPMDAYRKGDNFYIRLDLPGVRADSIDLTVEQNVLTIRAQRTPVEDEAPRSSSPNARPAPSPARSSSAKPSTPTTSAPTTPRVSLP